ncbi:MAG TPA: DNA methyltransferase [Sphingomicrobium sp.]|jgi:hypothetical protein|nr:DNA methyltransferase [Sphingomicrobium sp.]
MTNIVETPAARQGGVRSRRRIADNQSLPTAFVFDPADLRLFIKYVSPSDLKPPRRAVRKYSKRAMQRMQRAISEFGFIVPIIADAKGRIIVGHRRWLAAKDLGLKLIPVIEISHLSEEQLRMFTLLDNKLCEDGEWDLDELRIEFGELSHFADLNIEDTGFSTAECDTLLIAAADGSEQQSEDEVPEVQWIPVTQTGDIWLLGNHRLICGSSLDAETFESLLGSERAEMVFSDAPYNLSATTISGKGKHRHGDFAMASGEMPPREFTGFLVISFGLAAKFSVDGSLHFQCMDWRHMREMLDAGYSTYSELKQLIVWKKHSAGMGSFYRSQHELLFVWKSGTAPHINNFGLGETGRHRSNVWDYRGNAGFHAERDDELASHATVKPWSMVADAIRDCSKRGGIILDPFGGSGTTLIAAQRTGRKARLIELDPLYCDVTVRRWEKLTGEKAVLAATGETFADVEAVRTPVDEGFSQGEPDHYDASDEEAA